jgi:hypothetical protein
MNSTAGTTAPAQRYTLRITYLKDDEARREAAHLIYQSTSPTLVASLATLPYTVGRTFSAVELDEIHNKLKVIGIGHRFESTDGVSQVISFHPGDIKKEDEITGIRVKRRMKRRLLWILPTFAAVIFFAALYFLTNEESSNVVVSVERPKLAQVILVDSKVQKKSPSSLIWEELRENDWLSEGDSIRTFERARASIAYQEGSTILVRENSLIIIEKPSESSREFNLEDGSLQAKLRSGTTPYQFRIKTGGGTISMQSPEAQSESALQTSFRAGQFSVAVESGTAKIEAGGRSLDLLERQQVQISNGEAPEIKTLPPELLLETPNNNLSLSQGPYEFKVSAVEGAKSYRWIFGSSSDLSNRLLEQQTQVPELKLQYLDPGEIFWKVEVEIEGIVQSSGVRKLYVR